MRILQVLTDTDRRGAQIFGCQLDTHLTTAGFDVRTVALTPGTTTRQLPVDCLGQTRLGMTTLRRLRGEMADADLTIAHGSSTLTACGVASLGGRRPFVYRQISDPVFWTPTAMKRLRTKLLYRRPTHVIALSVRTKAIVQGRFGVQADRVTVIPNGVDAAGFDPATDADRDLARRALALPPYPHPVVAYLGALVPEKGVGDLVSAVLPGTTIVVAGEGSDQEKLAALARSRSADVRFLGSVDTPAEVLAAADVLALPSRAGDSQPAVLIEAALIGTPVLSTDVGAIADIVIDESTGLLVAPGDVSGLSSQLARLLGDEGLRHRLARAAQERAGAEFTMQVVGDRWAAVLRGLADQITRA